MDGLGLLHEVDLPPALHASLARHRENLAGMMDALRAVGLDDQAIEAHLSTLIESYRAELSAAIASLRAPA